MTLSKPVMEHSHEDINHLHHYSNQLSLVYHKIHTSIINFNSFIYNLDIIICQHRIIIIKPLPQPPTPSNSPWNQSARTRPRIIISRPNSKRTTRKIYLYPSSSISRNWGTNRRMRNVWAARVNFKVRM